MCDDRLYRGSEVRKAGLISSAFSGRQDRPCHTGPLRQHGVHCLQSEWIAPPSVLVEDLLPRLHRKNYSILEKHGFSVSYQGNQGNPVNPAKIDWGRVNIDYYTFTQKPGPHSNLGKIKFLFPNRHTVYMHDTFPARRKVFQEAMRAIGYGCVRMEKPDQFAGVLLAEDKGWPASRVKDLWDDSVNSPVRPLRSRQEACHRAVRQPQAFRCRRRNPRSRKRRRRTPLSPEPLPKEEQAVDFLTLPSTHDHARTDE